MHQKSFLKLRSYFFEDFVPVQRDIAQSRMEKQKESVLPYKLGLCLTTTLDEGDTIIVLVI